MQPFLISTLSLLLVLCSTAYAHKEIAVFDPKRGPLAPCRQRPVRASDLQKVDMARKAFHQIYVANASSFQAIGALESDFCFNVNTKLKVPQMVSNPRDGTFEFSPSFLAEELTEEILAGILAHESAHILLGHHHPSKIPYSHRSHLSPAQIQTVQNFRAHKYNLETERFYRTDIIDNLEDKLTDPKTADDFLLLIGDEGLAIVNRLLDDDRNKKPQYTFVAPYMIDDSSYNQLADILELRSKGLQEEAPHLVDKARGIATLLRDHNNKIAKFIGQVDQSLSLLNVPGHTLSPNVSLQSYIEVEADTIGYELFKSSNYKSYVTFIHFFIPLYLTDYDTNRSAEAYCDSKKELGVYELDNGDHPHLCWRLQNIMSLARPQIPY